MPIKVCPVQGPWMVGHTNMMLGDRTIRTWNPTTKQWETITRRGLSQGSTGEKVFKGKPSQLI